MDIGMPTLIENDSLRQNVELCVSLGLRFVELNMNLPEYQPENITDDLMRYMRDVAPYFTVHLDENLNVADFNGAVSAAYFDTVKRTIDLAHKINAPILSMHLNHGVYFTLPDRKVYLFEKYANRYKAAYARLREICESEIGNADIIVCIENTDGWKKYETDIIGFLLESKVFGLTFDIGHSHAIGNTDEAFITEHKSKLRHFHIHDAIGKKNHLALGSGEIDLASRLDLAKSCNCRCVAETKTVDALKRSAAWLRSDT